MVSKWSVKNPLSLDERKKIYEGLQTPLTYQQIAAGMNRSKSTVRRESMRLGDIKDYDPEKAQQHFEALQVKKNSKMQIALLEHYRNKMIRRRMN
jgi:IS30 family transposase